jgi:type VI secretion system protein ImpJ
MTQLSRVVWTEGMALAPHHFQMQNRYFEDLIDFQVRALHQYPAGIAGVEWDDAALSNGTLTLVHARGVFPDGLPFLFPESDLAPAARPVNGLLPPLAQNAVVHLAIPKSQEGRRNFGDDESVRYTPVESRCPDETTGLDPCPITCGRKNFRLLLDAELSPDWVSLPMGRVMRDGAGHLAFDREFIPPCIRISASSRLLTMTRRLLDQLEEKAASLASERSFPGISQREVICFWYLHCINSGAAELRHLSETKQCHPEELYRAMLRLAGSLCTFVVESDLPDPRLYYHPGKLPLYNHGAPESCFFPVERHIRVALDAILPPAAMSIPLIVTGAYRREGEVPDSRVLGRARWILGVRANVSETTLIAEVPSKIKVCALKFLDRLIAHALPGLELVHLPNPPAEVKPKPEMQYFSVSRLGPCWDHIAITKKVGLYVPGKLSDAEVELIVITEA